jgi:hypothetical protein
MCIGNEDRPLSDWKQMPDFSGKFATKVGSSSAPIMTPSISN